VPAEAQFLVRSRARSTARSSRSSSPSVEGDPRRARSARTRAAAIGWATWTIRARKPADRRDPSRSFRATTRIRPRGEEASAPPLARGRRPGRAGGSDRHLRDQARSPLERPTATSARGAPLPPIAPEASVASRGETSSPSPGFEEKPDAKERPLAYLGGRAGTRGTRGMFVFSGAHHEGRAAALAPGDGRPRSTGSSPGGEPALRSEWPKLRKISIDYAVLEKARAHRDARGRLSRGRTWARGARPGELSSRRTGNANAVDQGALRRDRLAAET